ncbi:MAG: hypothetical protein IJ689_07705 [Alphaproteobacteria bacterium]|nr:hypothetical protein [Alphaproteobacteria bacterium]MBR1649461.1 hypothetical protein [Alphaproteobacteria bacterium]
MKKWLILLVMTLWSFQAQSAEFMEGMDDIPLPDGLRQLQSASISFGNTESRFEESYISSNQKDFGFVTAFYKNTLPQLGWIFVKSEKNSLHFERDMEVLDIALEKTKPLLVRITLKSKD